jgi:hypothetical protein
MTKRKYFNSNSQAVWYFLNTSKVVCCCLLCLLWTFQYFFISKTLNHRYSQAPCFFKVRHRYGTSSTMFFRHVHENRLPHPWYSLGGNFWNTGKKPVCMHGFYIGMQKYHFTSAASEKSFKAFSISLISKYSKPLFCKTWKDVVKRKH